MRLSEETKEAMRIVSRLRLGSEAWAEMFIRIVEANDPAAAADFYVASRGASDSSR